MPVSTHAFVEIRMPEASALANLAGVHHDLESARQFANTILNIYSDRYSSGDLIDPLTTALVVRYCRAFKGGIRNDWPRERAIDRFDEEEKRAHQYVLDMRDKYFAHSVNDHEINQPVARYCEERVKEEGIYGIECNRTRTIGLSGAEVDTVSALCSKTLAFVDELIKEEKKKLLVLVRTRPIEEVLAWGVSSARRYPDASKKRRPF